VKTLNLKVDRGKILLLVVLAIAFLTPLFVTQPYYLHVLTMCLFWAYLACSWNIVGGFAGQLSLGHGMFTAMGAYVTVILFNTFGLSPWLGMFVGGAAAVLLSLIIGWPTFSLRGAYFALATVALSEGLVVLIENT
jgi:branched-chain amino acid transport system permease protein